MKRHPTAEQRIKLGLMIHLGVYGIVITSLVAMNSMRNPDKMWSLWVAGGWGLGIALHAVLISIPAVRKRAIARAEARMEHHSDTQRTITT